MKQNKTGLMNYNQLTQRLIIKYFKHFRLKTMVEIIDAVTDEQTFKNVLSEHFKEVTFDNLGIDKELPFTEREQGLLKVVRIEKKQIAIGNRTL